MSDYISREAVQTVFNGIWDCSDMNFGDRDNICVEVNADCASCRWLDTKKAIEKMVMEIPAADAVEVRHGQWERVDYGNGCYNYHCSSCRHIPRENIRSNYCPNCGADMRGGVSDGKA